MRNLDELKKYAVETGLDGGAYQVPGSHAGIIFNVIACNGRSWDQVSVKAVETTQLFSGSRCPTWMEMEFIAQLFFKPDEIAMQLHLPRPDHLNIDPSVLHWLHWWHPKLRRIPLPPKSFVGVKWHKGLV